MYLRCFNNLSREVLYVREIIFREQLIRESERFLLHFIDFWAFFLPSYIFLKFFLNSLWSLIREIRPETLVPSWGYRLLTR